MNLVQNFGINFGINLELNSKINLTSLTLETNIMYPISPCTHTAFAYFLDNFWFIYFVSMVVTTFLLAVASDNSPIADMLNKITELLESTQVLDKLFGVVGVTLLPAVPFLTFVVFILVTLFWPKDLSLDGE
jgi:hypothetical protein